MIDDTAIPCAEWQEKLSILPPDRLSSADQQSLEAHLLSCEACRTVSRQYSELAIALRHLSADALPAGIPSRLLQYWQETGVLKSSQQTQRESQSDPIPHRRFSMKVTPKRLALASVLAAVLLVSLVFGIGVSIQSSHLQRTPVRTGAIPYSGPTLIVFNASISYHQALRLISDVGLQPSSACFPSVGHYTPGSALQPQPVWQPVGQREIFVQTHQLWVQPTFSAPLDWRLRLEKITGVHFGTSRDLACPQVIYGTPPSGVIMPLNSAQAGSYVRVTFTKSQTYDTALYTVLNLGLGLANYCYEQAVLAAGRRPAPSWQFAGQEAMFARTHTLLVKTTALVTSSLWQSQLRTQPGVVSVQINYTAHCPKS